MVRFVECDAPATNADVDALETRLGFKVPNGIRSLLTTSNGGRPEPMTYLDSRGDINVSECLALREGKGSIWWTYELLILTKQAAPRHYLPFAVASAGNVFLVDCTSEAVYLLLHEPTFRLVSRGVTLDEFWSRLH